MKPHISAVASESYASALYDLAVKREASSRYEQLSQSEKAQLTIETFEEIFTSWMNNHKHQLEETVAATLPTVRKNINEQLQQVGIFCLTENPDSLLMWAHYADSHRGFVIEFDGESPFFNQAPRSPSDMRCLHQITYSKTRPSIILSEVADFTPFFTKSNEWDYEMEWRMMLPTSEASTIIKLPHDTIHLFIVPKTSIISIIFGSRASDSMIKEIKSIIASDNEFSHVKFKYARIDELHFKLNISDE
jgi:hypothetical protein